LFNVFPPIVPTKPQQNQPAAFILYVKINRKKGKREEGAILIMLSFIIYAILVIASIAAWLNTKIILEEIDKIKKHIGVPEDKPIDLQILSDNANNDTADHADIKKQE
jgi:hypothetical protein